MSGDIKYIDANGDGAINDSDRVFSGSGIPQWEAGLNFDLGYKFNIIKQINIGLYLRGQSMILGTIDPPIRGGGTLETLSIGLIFESPVYLIY